MSAPKATARARYRRIRDALPPSERTAWSAEIARHVLALREVEQAASVFAYVAFRSEVETAELIDALIQGGKIVGVPRTLGGGQMVAQAIGSRSELVLGEYGILNPPADESRILTQPDVLLVPALAFSPAGDRLGYGAGHYDRWLADHGAGFVVGLAFEAQVSADLPVEPHDIRMHAIVTERRVIRCGA